MSTAHCDYVSTLSKSTPVQEQYVLHKRDVTTQKEDEQEKSK